MKNKIFSLVFIFTSMMSYAQQDAQFTQYMYNTININPAYAGSRGVLSIFALHRSQWVGIDGAPITNAISMNTPLNGNNLGLGVSVVNDRVGPVRENAISTDLSYTIPTSETFKLSFGLKVTANLFDLNTSILNPVDNDPSLQQYNNKFSPNIGTGIYLHSSKAYVGISVPHIIETNHYNDNDVSVFKEKMTYYFISGYIFDLNSSIKFKPSMLSKITVGTPFQLDLSGSLLFNNKVTAGVSYRWNTAVSALVGFQISDSMYVGYTYDMDTTKLNKYNSGSHEIFLRFELFKTNTKMVTQRFF